MTTIKRSALVAYTARQMFELVNSIEEYPRFLPWCRVSQVITRADTEVEASLEITWSGIHKSFTTCNHLYPYERIDITLVKGPFRHLEGRWEFIALGEQGCKINLELEFELTGHLVDKVFQPIFHHIANSLVDAFCRRAVDIYGNG
ncbi:MAG: cyclase/dehydrase [uncultured bacterium]|nr:MAG: cyclase/dehydrase [uncultured bacterium]